VATDDLDLGGRLIRKATVSSQIWPANRDAEVFPDPNVFDIHRHARRHVAFSHGPHNCVGQSLARLELEIAFRGLLTWFPDLALAMPQEQIPFRPHTMGLAGVKSLLVSW
jgi:cytochrome P450